MLFRLSKLDCPILHKAIAFSGKSEYSHVDYVLPKEYNRKNKYIGAIPFRGVLAHNLEFEHTKHVNLDISSKDEAWVRFRISFHVGDRFDWSWFCNNRFRSDFKTKPYKWFSAELIYVMLSGIQHYIHTEAPNRVTIKDFENLAL